MIAIGDTQGVLPTPQNKWQLQLQFAFFVCFRINPFPHWVFFYENIQKNSIRKISILF